jgi:hypothetical protein
MVDAHARHGPAQGKKKGRGTDVREIERQTVMLKVRGVMFRGGKV